MGIKEKIYPYLPQFILGYYRNLKRLFGTEEERTRKYKETGNNIALRKVIDLDAKVLESLHIDSVKVTKYMFWKNPFVSDDYGKYQYMEQIFSKPDIPNIELVFNNYGLWTVEIDYLKNGCVKKHEVQAVKIEAPEYNIAYLAATLPVVLFLLDMWNISRKNCPTIIGLERVLIEYKKLPENIYPFPMASNNELNTSSKGFNSYFQRLVFYIGSLYKMNPNVKFNLYLCDHFAYQVLSLLYANRIPEENFHVCLLGDGVGSYECFNYVFMGENAVKTYEKMKKTWLMSKKMAFETGVQQRKKEVFLRCGSPCMSETINSKNETVKFSYGFSYAYVLAVENKNMEWLLHDPKMLNGHKKVLSLFDRKRIRKIDFINGINALEKHKDELLRIINVDFSAFKNSYSKNKKVCIFLGTDFWESVLEKYIDTTIKVFGNGYDYYYKGHPRIPIKVENKRIIENKGIKFLNAKIPTEFYMMLNPDIYLAGYISSSFLSIGLLHNPREQVLAIWDAENRKIKTNCLDFTAKLALSVKDDSIIINGE